MENSNSSPLFDHLSTMKNSQDLLNMPGDSEVWKSLKQAISSSSGFQSWQLERNVDNQLSSVGLDTLVRLYLRETLETLAY